MSLTGYITASLVLSPHVSLSNVDVSTVKMLSKLWDPELKNGAPVKKYGHRALEDIRESIEELVYYKERLWKVPSANVKGDNTAETKMEGDEKGEGLVEGVHGLKLED